MTILAAASKKRVCILTRSAFPGGQRHASAIRSGDIAGDWTTFRRQVPAGLSVCLTGMPYWTTDTGGFWHPEDPYASPDYNELLSRWFEWSMSSFLLRVRVWETRTEMWNWLPQTQKVMLAYDELRHRLLPYIYSLAWRVTSQGDTMMRALPMDFRSDTRALDGGDESMFGPASLVAPVTETKAENKEVYLPAGTRWVSFWTGKSSDGGESIRTVAPPDESLCSFAPVRSCRWVLPCSMQGRHLPDRSNFASIAARTGHSPFTKARGTTTITSAVYTRRSRCHGMKRRKH